MADDVPGYYTSGLDRYGASGHKVTVDHDEHHVTLTIENEEALLTPGQARMVAAWLIARARLAEELSEANGG